MLAIKELRSIYNHLESNDEERKWLGIAAMKTIRFSDWGKVEIIFETFRIEEFKNNGYR